MLDKKLDAARIHHETCVHNLHVDMLCQFQCQQEQFIQILTKLSSQMETVMQDNTRLIVENERLKAE